MKSLLVLLLGVTAHTMVNGLPLESHVCPANWVESGESFFAYKEDCEKYIQCFIDAEAKLTAIVRPCPFATFWNQSSLSCASTDDMVCQNDKCANEQDGINRDDNRNCRGYWECESGHSIPKCCPMGQRFERNVLGCVDVGVDEDECNATCFGDTYTASNETANDTVIDVNPVTPTPCAFVSVPDSPGSYYQNVHGSLIERPCGAGTQFNESACACLSIPRVLECKPELHLIFDSGNVVDKSNNGYYVRINNVLVGQYDGYFNGENSTIVIPRFNNIGHEKNMFINITYGTSSSQFTYTRGILSNDGCNGVPSSVRILEDDMGVTFSVNTTKNEGPVTVTVPQPSNNSTSNLKTVNFKFDGNAGYLTGAVNDKSASVRAEGFIKNVHCDLTIGKSSEAAFFHGTIEEIAIYLCDPNSTPSA